MVRFTSRWPDMAVVVRPTIARTSDFGERKVAQGRTVHFVGHFLDVSEEDEELLARLRRMPEYGSGVIEEAPPGRSSAGRSPKEE